MRYFKTPFSTELARLPRRLEYGADVRALMAADTGSGLTLDAEPMSEPLVESRPDAAAEFEERLAESSALAFRIALGVLRNREDAEDVAQEAFLRAYRNFHRLRDRERFRAWLARIAWRLALDRIRATGRRERREFAASADAPAPTVEDVAASEEFNRRLEQAVEELPEKLRQTLILAAIEGRDMQEVAKLLDLPEGTVKSRLHLARKKLAEKLRWFAGNTKTT